MEEIFPILFSFKEIPDFPNKEYNLAIIDFH